MKDYPKGVLRVYDNGGKTADRYTVYYSRRVAPAQPPFHSCLGMSENPTHPQGFGQHSEGQLGRHNGKLIPFSSLPLICQQCAQEDLRGIS